MHSYVSPKCRVGQSSFDRNGLFAEQSIEKGEIVAIWGGQVFSDEECYQLSAHSSYFETHTVSIYWGMYYGSYAHEVLDDSETINHSCNPNVGVIGQILLVARRLIDEGEELTFDYDTTEVSATPFQCKCGNSHCRKSIEGNQSLPTGYFEANSPFLSWYLSGTVPPTEAIQDCGDLTGIPHAKTNRVHSWLSPKCIVDRSVIDQLGIFAADSIKANELVAILGGRIYSSEELNRLSEVLPHMKSFSVQVADGFHLASNSFTAIDDASRFNHSCEPNVGVKGQILLLARRDIKTGEELTIDYETTQTDMIPISCQCQSKNCRGRITGDAWNQKPFIANHIDWLSWYILQRIDLKAERFV
ncbi:MAG: SET domain-containing protein-lysine N-methyltransferase [Pirellula sp.]|nr:SET domain-containing protein-lysine N-methyltransferase [Pirellula sp.]